jgi:hypothetical protein
VPIADLSALGGCFGIRINLLIPIIAPIADLSALIGISRSVTSVAGRSRLRLFALRLMPIIADLSALGGYSDILIKKLKAIIAPDRQLLNEKRTVQKARSVRKKNS